MKWRPDWWLTYLRRRLTDADKPAAANARGREREKKKCSCRVSCLQQLELSEHGVNWDPFLAIAEAEIRESRRDRLGRQTEATFNTHEALARVIPWVLAPLQQR